MESSDPYEFSPYIDAGDVSGSYWIIQPGGSSTVQHIISPKYRLEVKGVIGQGWILGWEKDQGVKVWPHLEKKRL